MVSRGRILEHDRSQRNKELYSAVLFSVNIEDTREGFGGVTGTWGPRSGKMTPSSSLLGLSTPAVIYRQDFSSRKHSLRSDKLLRLLSQVI